MRVRNGGRGVWFRKLHTNNSMADKGWSVMLLILLREKRVTRVSGIDSRTSARFCYFA